MYKFQVQYLAEAISFIDKRYISELLIYFKVLVTKMSKN